ncbi:unnamed protein product [Microthlaspi erraticum]|uniref:NYN domain-containing protein n=1 Tax=Microthlaspi erraticum TaxID=1685480 RepID=A0A6D2JFM2_9BRAS|nr:unnamed protein product [Microthlaspi erraticum]
MSAAVTGLVYFLSNSLAIEVSFPHFPSFIQLTKICLTELRFLEITMFINSCSLLMALSLWGLQLVHCGENKVNVYWDIEDCKIPDGSSLEEVASNIKSALKTLVVLVRFQ